MSGARVKAYLARNPGASNAQLYAAFLDVPKSSIRRIAASVPAVRKKRKLPARTPAVSRIAKKISPPVFSSRYGRDQIAITRKFAFTKLQPPFGAVVLKAMKEVFTAAKRAIRGKFRADLVAYLLIVQVARGAKLVRGRIVYDWEDRYLSLPSSLVRGNIDDLWRQFDQSVINKLNNIGRTKALINVPLSLIPGSDPIAIRPVSLTIFAHSSEDPSKLEGKRVSTRET